MSAAFVPGLLLASPRYDKNSITLRVVNIQRYVTTRTGSNDEFAKTVRSRPSEVRTGLEDLKGIDDLLNAFSRILDVVLQQVLEKATKIVQDFRFEDDVGQITTPACGALAAA